MLVLLVKVVKILVFLGHGTHCTGGGICRVERLDEKSDTCKACIHGVAKTFRDKSKTHRLHFELLVPDREIPDKIFLRYFTKESFELPEDLHLPHGIASELGFPDGYIIKKGKYSLEESSHTIDIKF